MGVGPSTKETSLHHFRDPLIKLLGEDPGIDLMGVLVFGSPEGNEEKIRCSRTAAVVAECARPDGPPDTAEPGPSARLLLNGERGWGAMKAKAGLPAQDDD